MTAATAKQVAFAADLFEQAENKRAIGARPTVAEREAVLKDLGVTYPSNYSRPEKLQAWIAGRTKVQMSALIDTLTAMLDDGPAETTLANATDDELLAELQRRGLR